MLEKFRVAKFKFTICAKERIRLPSYKGAAFRGGFGYTFKRVVCVMRGKECNDCILKQKCIYSYIFETPPPEDTEILRLYPKVPHPFVIKPPITEKQSFEPGESLSFQLVLIGKAIDYIPYFIYTFTELGKKGIGQGRGKYELLEVEGIGLNDETVPVYNHKDQVLTGHYPIIQAQQINTDLREAHSEITPQPNSGNQGEHKLNSNYKRERQSSFSYQSEHKINLPHQEEHQLNSLYQGVHPRNPPYQGGTKGGVKGTSHGSNHTNKITISLVTPMRLRFDNHITDKIEFHILIRNLLRRISSLSYFHCDEKLELDFKGLIEKSKVVNRTASDIQWFDWKRYSTRQEEWMALGGVTGTISYEGDISVFSLLLRLGEYVHVGKGTSFGLGKYEIFKTTEILKKELS